MFSCLSFYRLNEIRLADNILAVIKPQHARLNCEEASALQKLMNIEGSATDAVVTVYPKMMFNRKLIYSRQDKRVKRSNNVTVVHTDPQLSYQV